MPPWITWLIGFVLRGFGLGNAEKRQPDAEAQDKRADAVGEAARAETSLNDSKAVIAAQGASDATVTAAADDAAAVERRNVLNPAAVDSDPAGHWR